MALEWKNHDELFEKCDSGLKVKFDIYLNRVFYPKNSIIPIRETYMKIFNNGPELMWFRYYDRPENFDYTIRIESDGKILLVGIAIINKDIEIFYENNGNQIKTNSF